MLQWFMHIYVFKTLFTFNGLVGAIMFLMDVFYYAWAILILIYFAEVFEQIFRGANNSTAHRALLGVLMVFKMLDIEIIFKSRMHINASWFCTLKFEPLQNSHFSSRDLVFIIWVWLTYHASFLVSILRMAIIAYNMVTLITAVSIVKVLWDSLACRTFNVI